MIEREPFYIPVDKKTFKSSLEILDQLGIISEPNNVWFGDPNEESVFPDSRKLYTQLRQCIPSTSDRSVEGLKQLRNYYIDGNLSEGEELIRIINPNSQQLLRVVDRENQTFTEYFPHRDTSKEFTYAVTCNRLGEVVEAAGIALANITDKHDLEKLPYEWKLLTPDSPATTQQTPVFIYPTQIKEQDVIAYHRFQEIHESLVRELYPYKYDFWDTQSNRIKTLSVDPFQPFQSISWQDTFGYQNQRCFLGGHFLPEELIDLRNQRDSEDLNHVNIDMVKMFFRFSLTDTRDGEVVYVASQTETHRPLVSFLPLDRLSVLSLVQCYDLNTDNIRLIKSPLLSQKPDQSGYVVLGLNDQQVIEQMIFIDSIEELIEASGVVI